MNHRPYENHDVSELRSQFEDNQGDEGLLSDLVSELERRSGWEAQQLLTRVAAARVDPKEVSAAPVDTSLVMVDHLVRTVALSNLCGLRRSVSSNFQIDLGTSVQQILHAGDFFAKGNVLQLSKNKDKTALEIELSSIKRTIDMVAIISRLASLEGIPVPVRADWISSCVKFIDATRYVDLPLVFAYWSIKSPHAIQAMESFILRRDSLLLDSGIDEADAEKMRTHPKFNEMFGIHWQGAKTDAEGVVKSLRARADINGMMSQAIGNREKVDIVLSFRPDTLESLAGLSAEVDSLLRLDGLSGQDVYAALLSLEAEITEVINRVDEEPFDEMYATWAEKAAFYPGAARQIIHLADQTRAMDMPHDTDIEVAFLDARTAASKTLMTKTESNPVTVGDDAIDQILDSIIKEAEGGGVQRPFAVSTSPLPDFLLDYVSKKD